MSYHKLKIRRIHDDAIIPQYATAGAACFDLHVVGLTQPVMVFQGQPLTLRTGLAFEIPPGFVMLVFSRSGHGFNYDTRLANCVGVIDSDYRGEVMVRLASDSDRLDLLTVKNGDRIAQAMLVEVPRVDFVEADDLGETARGADGFGSTGS